MVCVSSYKRVSVFVFERIICNNDNGTCVFMRWVGIIELFIVQKVVLQLNLICILVVSLLLVGRRAFDTQNIVFKTIT